MNRPFESNFLKGFSPGFRFRSAVSVKGMGNTNVIQIRYPRSYPTCEVAAGGPGWTKMDARLNKIKILRKRCVQPPLLRLCERSEAYILARSANTGTKLLDFRPRPAVPSLAECRSAASPGRPFVHRAAFSDDEGRQRGRKRTKIFNTTIGYFFPCEVFHRQSGTPTDAPLPECRDNCARRRPTSSAIHRYPLLGRGYKGEE